jgi:hypothetical protein
MGNDDAPVTRAFWPGAPRVTTVTAPAAKGLVLNPRTRRSHALEL